MEAAATNIFNSRLFDGINESDCQRMYKCFGAELRAFQSGEVIPDYGDDGGGIFIIEKGSALLERIDRCGSRCVLERMTAGEVFGEDIAFANLPGECIRAICESELEVVRIRRSQIVKRCGEACQCHSRLVENLLSLISDKAMRLSERVEVLSNRSIREKLLCYFRQRAALAGTNAFVLPFSATVLADYICADRSAMTRELANMKKDGIIEYDHRNIRLLDGNEEL